MQRWGRREERLFKPRQVDCLENSGGNLLRGLPGQPRVRVAATVLLAGLSAWEALKPRGGRREVGRLGSGDAGGEGRRGGLGNGENPEHTAGEACLKVGL